MRRLAGALRVVPGDVEVHDARRRRADSRPARSRRAAACRGRSARVRCAGRSSRRAAPGTTRTARARGTASCAPASKQHADREHRQHDRAGHERRRHAVRRRAAASTRRGAAGATSNTSRHGARSRPIVREHDHLQRTAAPALTMKTAQPWKSCRNPSAIRTPQRSTITPIMPTRKLFIRIVSGIADRNSTHALPHRRLEQVGHDEAHRQQRKQVAQAVAGLGDLQLVAAEVDDVAFDEHG